MKSAFQPGDLIDDRFCILSSLGAGGTASVFLAEDPALSRRVAVKVLHAQLSNRSDIFRRFQREAVALTTFDHPGILKVYRFGLLADGTTPYLVTEFVEGKSLRALLDETGPLSCSEATQLLMPIVEALIQAHAGGVVHRDLKPENLLLKETVGGSPQPVVIDFGLCRSEQPLTAGEVTLTQEGLTLGTPSYMSPEQCTGQKADLRTDIYSLGCVFFEMLTGRKLFPGEMTGLVLLAHLNQQPATLKELDPQAKMPELAQTILDRCLAKDREQRYQSMSELLDDLNSLAELNSASKMRRERVSASSASMPAVSIGGGAAGAAGSRVLVPMLAGAVVLLLALAGGMLVFTDNGNKFVCADIIEKHYAPVEATALLQQGLTSLKAVRGSVAAGRVALEAANCEPLSHWSCADRIALDRSLIRIFDGDKQAQLPLKISMLQHALVYLSADNSPQVKRGSELESASQAVYDLVDEFLHDPTLSPETWVALHDIAVHYRGDRAPNSLGWTSLVRLYGESSLKVLGDRIDMFQASEVCRALIGTCIMHRSGGHHIFRSDAEWEDALTRMQQLAYRLGSLKRAGWAEVELAQYCLYKDRLDEARKHIGKAEELDKLVGLSGGELLNLQDARTTLAQKVAQQPSRAAAP